MTRPSEPQYLYKYVEVSSGSLSILTSGTLKYTCPLDFNDPFDCFPSYDGESIYEYYKQNPDFLPTGIKLRGLGHAKGIMERMKIRERAKHEFTSGKFVKALISQLGVLSLSRNPTNVLMWSHYANHHKGFVVEFKIDPSEIDENTDELMVSHPVHYIESRPLLSVGDQLNIDTCFLSKSIDWKYEEEERVLTTHQGPGIHPYSRSKFLNAVIAGSAIDSDQLSELRRATRSARKDTGKKIPIYRAEISKSKYKVYIPGHPNPLHASPN